MDGVTVANGRDLCCFRGLLVLAQLMGVTCVVLTGVWMGHYQGGFAWTENPGREFNFHPLFTIIGLIFLYAEGILAYRIFRNNSKLCIKIVHASLHVAALIFAALGLKAVFDSHNLRETPLANLYSLHSWLGLLVVIGFGLQWVLGFSSYLLPWAGMSLRTAYMPYHTFWGVVLLILATATALMGIAEKAMSHSTIRSYEHHSGLGTLINALGLLLIMFTGLVIYLVTKPVYKRPSATEYVDLHADKKSLPIQGADWLIFLTVLCDWLKSVESSVIG